MAKNRNRSRSPRRRQDPADARDWQRREELERKVENLADVGFEATDDARAFDETLLRRLKKKGRKCDRQLIAALRDALHDPLPTNAASHLATTLSRAELATALINYADQFDGPITYATAVPGDLLIQPSEIASHDVTKFKARMLKRLKRCDIGDAMVVAGVDYSLNSQASNKWPRHLQVHLGAWVFGMVPKEVTSRFQTKFGNTRRPLFSEPVIDARGLATYVVKAEFNRRITLDKKGTKPSSWPMGPNDEALVPLLRALAKHNVRDRLILIGCRLTRGRLVTA